MIFSRIKKWFTQEMEITTQTLWNNEVHANLFVAHIMCVSGIFALLFLVLNWLGVFWNDQKIFSETMLGMIATLVVPAVICLRLKGERRWLKTMLMLCFCVAFFGVEMLYMEHAILCLVIPVILSIRYYSKPATTLTAIVMMILAFLAEYIGVITGIGRMDLNRVYLPAGTTLIFPEFMKLRDAIPLEIIDRRHLWMQLLQHNLLVRFLILLLISLICIEIAHRGRKTILEQKAETEITERMKAELNLASQIQTEVLPNSFPPFPNRKEFSLYASMTTAKEVGGDFYDFFFVDENHLAMVIADVAGKGVGAALFMMAARTLIKTRAQSGGTPSEILADVNDQLCENNGKMLFVTVWLGILDITTGRGIASNAGHEHPAIRRTGEKYELITYPHSIFLGVFQGTEYEEHEFCLRPGDSLFVYTDGVPEAVNPGMKLFGMKRMIDALNRCPDAMPEEAIGNVRDDVNAFMSGADQFDDITMLCLKYNGPAA